MPSWRDIKAKGLARVHKTFVVPAVYVTHAAGTPLRVGVRVHTKISRTENEFTWPNAPGFTEIDPRIVFDVSEVAEPVQRAFVFVSASEVYLTGTAQPEREGYMAVSVVEAKPHEVAAFLDAFGPLGPEWDGILP